MPKDPEMKRAVATVLAGILTAAVLGWCGMLTNYALAHRERIVRLEKIAEHDAQDRQEIKALLKEIRCDLKEHMMANGGTK